MESENLMLRHHELPDGLRVRLRLVQSRDIPAIHALALVSGSALEALDVARLVRADPRRRIVICASALVGTTQALVGVAAMDADAEEPDLLCVEPGADERLSELLVRALRTRSAALSGPRAA